MDEPRFRSDGMRINRDGTTVVDRKPHINLKSNHFKYIPRIHRIWNPQLTGQAIADGKGWYK